MQKRKAEETSELGPVFAAQQADPINAFIAAKLEVHDGTSTPSGTLWQLYTQHCAEAGEFPMSRPVWGKAMKAWFLLEVKPQSAEVYRRAPEGGGAWPAARREQLATSMASEPCASIKA